MGLRKKVSDKVDDVAAAVIYAGQKVGGEKGERVASKVTGATLGRIYQPCNDPSCNGTCKPN